MPDEVVDPAGRTLELSLADLASVTDEVAAQAGVAQLAGALDSALPARARVPRGRARAAAGCALAAPRGARSGAAWRCWCDDDESRARGRRRGGLVRARGRGRVRARRAACAYGSGLEPAPHLVGERARGLGLLRAGGLVAISAAALVERVAAARRAARPPCTSSAGESSCATTPSRRSSSAGYTRVERVGDRGELAVRGDILDVFPTTGAEPVRIELFGDEVERISRFSVFTQRSLAELERSDLQPAREARRSPADVEEWTHEEDVAGPERPRHPGARADRARRDLRLAARPRAARRRASG